MFVVRTDLAYKLQPGQPMPKDAVSSLVLEPLDVSNNIVRFDTFASETSVLSSGAEVYELLFQIKGTWKLEPTHAVYASWQVGKPEYEAAFIESRRQLFNVRQRVLHTFTYDWLLKRLNQVGCYLVLGLYGDEDGATRLCREHPAIQQFTRSHLAETYSAVDITGLRCFRIEGQTLAAAHPNKA